MKDKRIEDTRRALSDCVTEGAPQKGPTLGHGIARLRHSWQRQRSAEYVALSKAFAAEVRQLGHRRRRRREL